jgi:hypothetical protein
LVKFDASADVEYVSDGEPEQWEDLDFEDEWNVVGDFEYY